MARSFRILVGVCGGISAYKSAELVRRLRERGHDVRCAMTPSASSFLGPLTLEVLSGHRVYEEGYLAASGSGEEEHTALASWAEVICVAPATANTLSLIALGLGSNFLTTTILAHSGHLVLAPAMHPTMWQKITARGYVRDLETSGALVVGPAVGPLASGETGIGRMLEPDQIAQAIDALGGTGRLGGRRVVVSAGPTREPLDPVRFISNRSSGKMGFLLASQAARQGAETVLVAGPVALPTPEGVRRVDVTTAREMQEAVNANARDADLIIMTAAVADFRPRVAASRKIKKREQDSLLRLDLEHNPDILWELKDVAGDAIRIGFAAETDHVEENALAKMDEKDLDVLVANDVSRSDIGFDSDDNEVTVYRRGRQPIFFPRRAKDVLAVKLIELFTTALEGREQEPTVAS